MQLANEFSPKMKCGLCLLRITKNIMQEIESVNSINDAPSPDASTIKDSETPIVIRAPRDPKLEFLLHFFTFGLYTSFWLVARIDEIKRITGKPYIPWLWFFVPWIWLAQIFALGKFIGAIQSLEVDNNLPRWRAWGGTWHVSVILITLFLQISDKIPIPIWTILLAFVAISYLFSYVQIRINHIKNALDGVEFTGKRKGYSIIEWIVLVPMLPIVLGLFGYLLISPLLITHLSRLPANSTYEDPQGRFQLPVLEEGWSIVEIGTHSNGEALVEFQGPIDELYMLVFLHDGGSDINSVSRFRIEEAHEDMSQSHCNEKRQFSDNQQSVISVVLCQGKIFGDPSSSTFAFIEADNEVYELYGNLSTIKYSYRKHYPVLTKMTQGFQPL